MSILILFLVGILGLIAGYFLRYLITKRITDNAEIKAKNILNEAKTKGQEIILEAKNNALKVLDDLKREEKLRQEQLIRIEKMLAKRESELETAKRALIKDREALKEKAKEIESLKNDFEQKKLSQIQELEKIAKLKKEEAKNLLLKQIEEENKEEVYQKIKKLENEGQEIIEKRAKELIIQAIQRYAQSSIGEFTTTAISLPSDEIKGKIIGKEGRNIKSIERLTGVDIIIDETPETLVLSCFDPIRRQIAKLAIEKLIADGRIHPARIEEIIEIAKQEIDKKIKEEGEAAIYETGVGPVDPKLVYLLGRLAFRTSFGQNVLRHSVEMAHIGSIIAQEIGGDVAVVKKAALFHDIGKAVDHEVQGTHVEIGIRILKKFGIDEKVISAMKSHHEEYPYATLEARIVQAADAISAARPGARRETVEFYLKRLEELERIANSFDGVEKSYAVQAGRELRVFVVPTKVDDLGAIKLAKDIAKKIEEEMKYPGEIKVNVIRETRAIEYAR